MKTIDQILERPIGTKIMNQMKEEDTGQVSWRIAGQKTQQIVPHSLIFQINALFFEFS